MRQYVSFKTYDRVKNFFKKNITGTATEIRGKLKIDYWSANLVLDRLVKEGFLTKEENKYTRR